MVKCPACGCVLEDDARFCNECGTRIEAPAAPLAPAAPAPAAPAAEAPKAPKEKKPLNKKLIAGIAGGVAVIALVVLLIALFAGGGSGKLPNYAYYLKDKELFSNDFSKSGANQITTRLFDSDLHVENQTLTYFGGSMASACAVSKDGRYIFFPDKRDSGGNTLYYRALGDTKKEPVKVDSDVDKYAVNDAATAVTYMKETNLYQFNMKKGDKEKLASNVEDFYVSDDGKSIIFCDEEGTVYSLTVGKEKEKLASEVEILRVTGDMKTVFYLKEDTLYKQVAGKEKEKIDSDVCAILRAYDSGEVYYVKEGEGGGMLADYVYDDMKAADAAMTEPEYPDYWAYDTQEAYDKAWEEYDKAWDEYYAKMDRDWLREDLKDWELYSSPFALCYFDGKEKTALSDAFTYYNGNYDFASDAPVIVFTVYDDSDFDKISLSDAQYVWDLEDMVEEALTASAKLYIANGKNVSEIDAEDISNAFVTKDGKTVFVLADYDDENMEATLYSAEVTKNGIKDLKELDSEVYTWYVNLLESGDVVYYKDVKNGKGELYMSGSKVDYDVALNTLNYHADSGKLAYFVDWNHSKDYGTLKVYNGKKAEKVAEDVHAFAFAPDGNLMYLAEYSEKNCKGDLYLSKGGKATKIDEDVVVLVQISDSKYHYIYF